MNRSTCQLIFAVALIIIVAACQSTPAASPATGKVKTDSTTIVINFNKQTDRQFTLPLGQVNPLYLDPIFVSPPAHTVDTTKPLQSIIRLAIDVPTYISIGFNVFHITPGDSVQMDFATTLATKMNYQDTVTLHSGNVFFIATRQRSPLFDKYVTRERGILSALKGAALFNNYFTDQKINEIADTCPQLVYRDFPNSAQDAATKQLITTTSLNRFYIHFIAELANYYHDNNDKELKAAMEGMVDRLTTRTRDSGDPVIDPTTWGKYGALYNFYKGVNATPTFLLQKFSAFNDTVQQFIRLNTLRDGLTSDTSLVNGFTYVPFQEAAKKLLSNPHRGVVKTGYISNALRSVEIFDVNDKKMAFGDLFNRSEQPYLIFDFCGTWCVPCMKEIDAYSKSKPLDNSKKVKPIWLFFENDKDKWQGAVKKYGLKKENCFVIVGEPGEALKREFGLLFDWGGEFPHHFVFSKDGKIVDKKAVNLAIFKEAGLPGAPSPENNNPILPLTLKAK